jgi:hypothetical protein
LGDRHAEWLKCTSTPVCAEGFKTHGRQLRDMTEVVPPKQRTCERCGREDVWDESAQKWVVDDRDGEPNYGKPHCLHEWDINGAYNPLEE